MVNLKRAGRWKSDKVVEGYLEESDSIKEKVANILQSNICVEPPRNILKSSDDMISKYNNCTFNINVAGNVTL